MCYKIASNFIPNKEKLFPIFSFVPNMFHSNSQWIPINIPFLNEGIMQDDAPPNSLKDSNASSKVKITEKNNSGTLFNSQHFGIRGACWNFEMGIKMNNK